MRRTSHPVCVPEQQQLVAELLDAALADPWSGLRQPPRQHPHAPDFERLEQEVARAFPVLVGFRYPAVLRLLYERELPRIDCGLVRLEASAGADPVAHLRAMVFEQYDPERIAGRGLVAIAEEGSATSARTARIGRRSAGMQGGSPLGQCSGGPILRSALE